MQNHLDMNSSVPTGQTSGPLYSHIPGFVTSLASRGYSKASIAYRLCLLRTLDQWMRQRRMAMQELSKKRIEQFLRYRRMPKIFPDAYFARPERLALMPLDVWRKLCAACCDFYISGETSPQIWQAPFRQLPNGVLQSYPSVYLLNRSSWC